MRHITYNLDAHDRLDKFLAQELNSLSRSSIEKLIDQHKVWVNDKVEKPSHKLRTNDQITVDYSELDAKIPSIKLPVLYEDDDCIVIDKPVGILTHSKGAFNPEATAASFIKTTLQGFEPNDDRAGIVHRLDRATSGVLICAKNPKALEWLQKQFSTRKTKKTYIAVIKGKLGPSEAIIDMPIARNPHRPKEFHVSAEGKPAQTHYRQIKSNDTYSLLELKPVTGRTHQLRVHLAQQNHPIVGDQLYGGKPYSRLMLHAKDLEITLPDRTRKVFSAPLPTEFENILHQ